MPPSLERCKRCCKEKYPNQLIYSEHHGGKVCASCRADQGPDHFRGATKMVDLGEIQANKREAARAKAWNNGNGYGEEATQGERR